MGMSVGSGHFNAVEVGVQGNLFPHLLQRLQCRAEGEVEACFSGVPGLLGDAVGGVEKGKSSRCGRTFLAFACMASRKGRAMVEPQPRRKLRRGSTLCFKTFIIALSGWFYYGTVGSWQSQPPRSRIVRGLPSPYELCGRWPVCRLLSIRAPMRRTASVS